MYRVNELAGVMKTLIETVETSIGKTFWVMRRKNAVVLFGNDQRINIRASGQTRLKGRIHDSTRTLDDRSIPLAPRAPSIHEPLQPSAIQSSCVAVFLFDQLVRAQQDRSANRGPSALAVVIEHGLVFHRQGHRQIR